MENFLLMLIAFAALSMSIYGISKKSIVPQITGQCLGVVVLFLILNKLLLHG